MDILYYGLGSNQGGIETYLYKLARNINKEEFRLFYIDETGGQACFRKELEELGAKFFDVTPRRISLLKNRRDLKKLFNENKFDVLHFNCNTLSYIAPVLYALKHNINVVLHSRNSGSTFLSTLLHKMNFFRLALHQRNRKLQRIAVSTLAGQWMFGKRRDFEVINNGIEIEKFRFNENMRRIKRNELGVKDKNVYGNIGAFLEAKNHSFLIKIFKEIIKRDENAILILVGDGTLQDSIKVLVKELNLVNSVMFLGIRSDIPQLMMAMDCFIFPSLYEGFPNVILEAETTGLPIVMSDVITKEVVILDTCKQLSLEKSVSEWECYCRKMLNCENYRCASVKIIEQKGFSVRDEIMRIEKIYRR